MSASGTVGTDPAAGTSTTQKLYDLTPDENNNIFAVSTGKIPGATNSGVGGRGYGMGNNGNSSFNQQNLIYTTIVAGENGNADANQFGNPFVAPKTTTLTTNATTNTIALSQNYLPLGITANVKDAYFNHNGII